MLCAMSGQTPEEPVVSRSGHIYEKSVILKYIKQNGKDPMTNEPLSEEELISVQANPLVKPRELTSTSIPGMLSIFQSEWDSIMLEVFGLRKELDQVKQELSHSLYQHDAACRVIARLIKERDEARSALSNAKTGRGAESEEAEKMDIEVQGELSDQVVKNIESAFKRLSKARRKHVVSQSLPVPDEIKNYRELSSQSLHLASQPGLTCVDIHRENLDLIVTGGVDKSAIVYNKASDAIVATLKHTKKVNDVLFHPSEDVIFTASQDKTAKIWAKSGKTYKASNIKSHTDEVLGLDISPTGSYFATSGADNTWGFHDISTATTLLNVSIPSTARAIQFHPDGLILGTGSDDAKIRIFDVKGQTIAAELDKHSDGIVDLSFSENGFYLASASKDGTVKLWDLRKPKDFHTIQLEAGVSVTSCNFDFSGSYLIIGGSDIRIYHGKKFDLVKTFDAHEKLITDVQFAQDASYFVSTSMDRHLKLFGR